MFPCFRNQSYHARVQLAVLDHNAHLDKQHLHNKDSDHIYSCKFRKQTKKWGTTPTLKKKKYEYIPGLMDDIFSLRSNTSKPTERLEESHPIGNVGPPPTAELVARFN